MWEMAAEFRLFCTQPSWHYGQRNSEYADDKHEICVHVGFFFMEPERGGVGVEGVRSTPRF